MPSRTSCCTAAGASACAPLPSTCSSGRGRSPLLAATMVPSSPPEVGPVFSVGGSWQAGAKARVMLCWDVPMYLSFPLKRNSGASEEEASCSSAGIIACWKVSWRVQVRASRTCRLGLCLVWRWTQTGSAPMQPSESSRTRSGPPATPSSCWQSGPSKSLPLQ